MRNCRKDTPCRQAGSAFVPGQRCSDPVHKMRRRKRWDSSGDRGRVLESASDVLRVFCQLLDFLSKRAPQLDYGQLWRRRIFLTFRHPWSPKHSVTRGRQTCAQNSTSRQDHANNWQDRESPGTPKPNNLEVWEKGSNMRNWLAASVLFLLSETTTGVVVAQTGTPRITITPSAEQKVVTGSRGRFKGSVRVQSLFDPAAPNRTSGGAVTFQPAARSAWHTHPLGQILIVTEGKGWLQQWGGPVQVICKGDVVWIPPGVKHWHGATPTTAMTHIAVQEALNGVAVNWLEQVTNGQDRPSKSDNK